MPVPPMTYVYLILTIADFLCLCLSLYRRNGKAEIFAPCLFMLFIGFMCNGNPYESWR